VWGGGAENKVVELGRSGGKNVVYLGGRGGGEGEVTEGRGERTSGG